jgi:hypothetical protein
LAETRKKSVSDIQDELNGSEGDVIKLKLNSYFNKNEGFQVMCKISCLLEGEDLADSEDVKDLSLSDIVCYKCARLLSCDVEQTFSVIRSLFHITQIWNTQLKDLKMTFMVHYNSASLSEIVITFDEHFV